MGEKLAKLVASNTNEVYWMFYCPACGHLHMLDKRWGVDEDKLNKECPTVSGSYLQYGSEGALPRCHLFIKQGKLQYLSDCEHEYKNQTIDMPDVPDWARP